MTRTTRPHTTADNFVGSAAGITAGIDVGAQTCKTVVVQEGRIMSAAVLSCGWDTVAAVRKVFDDALAQAGITRTRLAGIGATGIGRQSVSFAQRTATEATCTAKGAVALFPQVRTILDVGAEQSRLITCDAEATVQVYERNEHCAAGTGAFLEEMAAVLEMDVVDLAAAAAAAAAVAASDSEHTINSTCTIFAESEVISLVNEGIHKEVIAAAVCRFVVGKMATLVRTVLIHDPVLFIGGVAQNTYIVDKLANQLGIHVIAAPAPQFVTAYGAALMALDIQ